MIRIWNGDYPSLIIDLYLHKQAKITKDKNLFKPYTYKYSNIQKQTTTQ